MGFGLVFLGFVTFLSFKIFPVGIVGTALMYFGLSRLCRHADYFKRAKQLDAVFFVYFALFTVLKVLNLTGLLDGLNTFQANLLWSIDEIIYSVIFFVFCFALCNALKRICKQVGYDKGVNKNKLCSAFLNVFGIGAVVRFATAFTSVGAAIRFPLVLVELLSIVSISAWIYSCYMMIATQEIIDDEKAKIAKYDQRHSKKLR